MSLTYPNTNDVQTTAYNTAASGSDSVITISAVTDGWTVIDFISFSYLTAAATGLLTITDTTANTVLLKVHVTGAGLNHLTFGKDGFICPKSAAVEVNLLDATVAKHMTVGYR